MFVHQLRLECAGGIARRLQFELTASAFHRLAGLAVLAVLGQIFGQMRIEFCIKRRFSQPLYQRIQNGRPFP